ncbi:MAG: transposase IS200-family protein [Chloroflexi bacterium]|nr:transposase IS200-family protein [Chloroflexota bacterium]
MTDHAEPDHRAYLERSLGAHAASTLQYHLVWSVKARYRVLLGPVATALRADLLRTADSIGVTILALHVEPELVHLLVSLRPDIALATVVGRLKGASARRLRETFPSVRAVDERGCWSTGYFARTLGDITIAQAKAYLDRQREHHE